MILKRKILLLFVLVALSAPVFAQVGPPKPSSKEQVKAEKEAKEKAEKAAKEKAEADVKAKERERRLYEQLDEEVKNNVTMSETVIASVNAKAEVFYNTAMNQINAKHIIWIKQNAKKAYVEKMDNVAFEIMANLYGKNAGLSEKGIEGLQVLLLRETYQVAKKELKDYQNQSADNNQKRLILLIAQEKLADSNYHFSNEQLDSVNLLINKPLETEMVDTSSQMQTSGKSEASEMLGKKEEHRLSVSYLSLTLTSLAKNIDGLEQAQQFREARIQEISQRQQYITKLLWTLVNDVTDSQEKIIQSLK